MISPSVLCTLGVLPGSGFSSTSRKGPGLSTRQLSACSLRWWTEMENQVLITSCQSLHATVPQSPKSLYGRVLHNHFQISRKICVAILFGAWHSYYLLLDLEPHLISLNQFPLSQPSIFLLHSKCSKAGEVGEPPPWLYVTQRWPAYILPWNNWHAQYKKYQYSLNNHSFLQ